MPVYYIFSIYPFILIWLHSCPALGDFDPAVVLETLAISMVWIEQEREGAREGVKHGEK